MNFLELMHQLTNHLFTQNPIIGSPPIKETIHNGKITYLSNDEELNSGPFAVKTDIEIPIDYIIDFNLEKFTSSVFFSANDSIENVMKGFFQELNKVTAFSGNSIDARGEEFSYDMLLDTLEKSDIRFDENDEPIFPKMVVNPSLAKKISELEITENHKKREKDIICKKREEHLAKKCYRKLSKISFRD